MLKHPACHSLVFFQLKTMTMTMDRLANENRLLKERFDKLDEKVIYFYSHKKQHD